MDRSYDVFVDNGLYILAHYLKKSIEEITLKDIEDSIGLMSEKVEEFLSCEKYSSLKSMVLFNSTVSNPSLKNVKLETALKEFMNQKGTDYCMLCGQNHANLDMNLKGRSYLPNRPGATFFNFSNNLHNINVCPYCLLLTTYSVMNCRICGLVYLYNSSDDEFMSEYTITLQEENIRDISSKAKKVKKNESKLEILEKMIDNNINFESEVEIYSFNNGKKESIDSERIYYRNIELLRKLRNKSLDYEFKKLGLSWMIVGDKLNSGYLKYVYDFEKEKLKCSKELFDFLNKEVNMLSENTLNLINRVSKDLSNTDIDIEKIRNNLKNIRTIRAFEDELTYISDMYYDKTDKKLFSGEEFNELINPMKFRSVLNMMRVVL